MGGVSKVWVDAGSHLADDGVEGWVDAGSHLADDGVEGLVDAGSHLADDGVEGLVDAGSHLADDGVEGMVDAGSRPEEGDLDLKDFHPEEVKTVIRFAQSSMESEGSEFEELDDLTENRENLSVQSVNGDDKISDAPKNLESDLILRENGDSEFDKFNVSKVFQDILSFNTSNTMDPSENSRNEDQILNLEEQSINESHLGKTTDEHLKKVQRDEDSDLKEFVEKQNFDKVSVALEDPDFLQFNIDEFQSSGDMDDSFDVALTDTRLESKSGRIIDFFPRGNNTAECTTPKGEPGHCRSVTQCPLSALESNFNLFLQYVCLSRGVLIGICCPDNPVIEISDPTENSTGTNVTEFKQPDDGCGLNSNTRIVGGKVSLPHEWTWMVALLRRNRFFCGGVIINDWYILTAAHCVMGIKVKDLKVRLGEYNFSEKNEHQEDIPVAEIKRHALFVTLTFQHDIALLKLKRRIEYTKFIGSICLPNPKSGNYTNVNATVVGWGTVAFGGTASPVLRQVTVPVWDNDECDRTYRLERITNAFMCAGSPENGEDACQGDSGGPLMTLSEEGRWEVIGIVSWGRRCGDPTFPGVYTRVSSYLNWITENAN
ncbi:Proclotting enzyme like protein [Argiope bruennichi]|uniref:Proclotting enzyme like protein n=1 Tax=Argiope bruennichi TaxID=94029 RepID=A0A8T0FPI7_ARGBR|nr:Proclotting enzyme like protein [Argiope bruennichi]